MPDFLEILILFVAAIGAGAMNAVAGGGTFLIFPALVMTGVPMLIANATCTVAVFPGAVASAFAFRKELKEQRSILPLMITLALVGGSIGAALLIVTPATKFDALVPWLLLGATLLFAFGRQATRKMIALTRSPAEGNTPASPTAVKRGKKYFILAYVLQIFIAIYGGFFGAGIGILNLAMLQILGMENIHSMNALKTIIGAAINLMAVIIFIWSGLVSWPHAAVMVVGAVIGGYYGAHTSLKFPPEKVRLFIVGIGIAMTVYFFVR